jgi:hypothetical protein
VYQGDVDGYKRRHVRFEVTWKKEKKTRRETKGGPNIKYTTCIVRELLCDYIFGRLKVTWPTDHAFGLMSPIVL